MTVYLGDKAVGVNTIVEKEVPKVKFGATVDTFLGDVDGNGVLQNPSAKTELNFAGVKELDGSTLQYAFYNTKTIIGVVFDSLITVGSYGLGYTFFQTAVETAVFGALKNAGPNAFNRCFYFCSSLKTVYLGLLTTIDSRAFDNAFYGCQRLESINLDSLEKIGSFGLTSAFGSCGKLTTISFPSLTDVATDAFGNATYSYAFRDSGLTEIHFRADMQASIEAVTGYAEKWGATNATIYFDL